MPLTPNTYRLCHETTATAPDTEPESKYDYTARRILIRTTWMRAVQRYKHVAVKFVVRSYSDAGKQASLEQRSYGDFIILPEAYPNVEYIVKADDDVLILPERLLMVADQWSNMKADYVGCTGTAVRPSTATPASQGCDPHSLLVGDVYPLYFHSSVYVLSGRIVRDVVLPNFEDLRTCLEDVSVSWWMLASDAVYFEDRRLCRLTCDNATAALVDQEQQGFPTKYWSKVMSNPGCTRTPKFPLPYVPVQYRKYPGLRGNARAHGLRSDLNTILDVPYIAPYIAARGAGGTQL